MAKKKEKNSAKSLAMVLITGITLVAATLCWFAIMDKSVVEPIKRAEVKNESSTFANIYFGADKNDKIAIRTEDIDEYIKIESREIILENMFPAAEYTYMAEFKDANVGNKITLDLNDIANVKGNLMSSVKLNRRISLITANGKETTDERYRDVADETTLDKESTFEYIVPLKGTYRVYFSFKIDESVKVENGRNMSVNIENVDAVISSS